MRILLVEDERRMAEAIRRGLQAHSFTVDVVHDGHSALASAAQQRYAAIVLDLMLPGLNGYRVCAELRRTGDATPVLMLTAKDGEYDEAEALDTGADDYLRKPFSYVVLVARLRALLRRGGGAPPVLRVGDLVLDPATRTCERAGRPVDLTPKEFDVLECLMRRAGEVVAKTEILDQVWDLHYARDVNLVEVYVSAVRRKVDAPFGVRTIHTVRGVGYRLEDFDA
ncbi:response regulator transcription factor [Planosporangium thailandense]|uniref:Response regulator transcription factor n=1 Tax=Planosporangium thailandense TaxID=765197 RepID=A0ABX0XWX6_9ACTN|nr:response regulator transcription factor [Planosporangium thailandense]NJC70530.1 response regulator transcription factor [Planosporangium thailandense]